MIYAVLAILYVMIGVAFAAFYAGSKRQPVDLRHSGGIVFFWPLIFPIVAGLVIAEKMRYLND